MPNRPSKLLPVAGFAIFLALIVAGIAWRQAGMPQGPAALAAATAGEARLNDVPAAASAARAAPSPARAAPSDRVERFMSSKRIERQASSDRMAAVTTSLANKHRNEPVDPQWAGGMEATLQGVAQNAAFAESGIKADSLDIDCKSSTCRIDAGLPSRGNAADWATVFMSSVGSDIKRAYTSVVAAPDGTTHVVIYAEAR